MLQICSNLQQILSVLEQILSVLEQETLNLEQIILNLEQGTLNLEQETFNLEQRTLDLEQGTLNLEQGPCVYCSKISDICSKTGYFPARQRISSLAAVTVSVSVDGRLSWAVKGVNKLE